MIIPAINTAVTVAIPMQRGPYMGGPPMILLPPPRPRSWFPWLTPCITIAIIGMFVYSLHVNDCPSRPHRADRCTIIDSEIGRFTFQPLSENPMIGPSTETLKKLGALQRKLVVDDGEKWRLLSCMWLHGGVIHITVNLISLTSQGFRLEREFGFIRLGILYLLSAYGGSLVSCLNLKISGDAAVSVGASGALFGLLGATLSELITNWTLYQNKCEAFCALIMIIIINLAIGLIPHVDISAHVGGFLAGFFLGFVLLIRPQFGYVSKKYVNAGYGTPGKSRYKVIQLLLLIVALAVTIFGYLYAWYKLFGGLI